MLNRESKKSAYPVALVNSFNNTLLQITRWAEKKNNVAITYINHSDTIKQPMETAQTIKNITCSACSVQELAKIVDKKLYRQKNKK